MERENKERRRRNSLLTRDGTLHVQDIWLRSQEVRCLPQYHQRLLARQPSLSQKVLAKEVWIRSSSAVRVVQEELFLGGGVRYWHGHRLNLTFDELGCFNLLRGWGIGRRLLDLVKRILVVRWFIRHGSVGEDEGFGCICFGGSSERGYYVVWVWTMVSLWCLQSLLYENMFIASKRYEKHSLDAPCLTVWLCSRILPRSLRWIAIISHTFS